MPEAIVWPESVLFMWTGSATASAIVGLAQNAQMTFADGWANDPALNGVYRDHLTGSRADVLIGGYLTYGNQIERLVAARTALHLKLVHSALGISAGRLLWSGRVDAFGLLGGEGQPYAYSLAYHANAWSAF